MKNIVFIVGSLRKNSYNKQLAQFIEQKIANQASITYLDYSNIPYMNEDIEFPTPSSIQQIREQIKKADGLWIFTPEYNYEIPGLLKNLLDWLSRPEIKNDWKTGSVIKNKSITISSVAGKSKGLGARRTLSELLERIDANLIHQVGVGISFKPDTQIIGKIQLSDEEERLLNEQIQLFLEKL